MFYAHRVLTRAGPEAHMWVADTFWEVRLPRRWMASASILFFPWGSYRLPIDLDEENDHDVLDVMVEKTRQTTISPARG